MRVCEPYAPKWPAYVVAAAITLQRDVRNKLIRNENVERILLQRYPKEMDRYGIPSERVRRYWLQHYPDLPERIAKYPELLGGDEQGSTAL